MLYESDSIDSLGADLYVLKGADYASATKTNIKSSGATAIYTGAQETTVWERSIQYAQLDFHVNSQLSLAVTENGLALPQYDVEMKGKYTAASVEPTYAWEFRNATGTSPVYDMVGGVAADPSGGATSGSAGMVFDADDDIVNMGLSLIHI